MDRRKDRWKDRQKNKWTVGSNDRKGGESRVQEERG
jgi:hypothetical protein